jgi:hypothetical protein
MFGNYTRAIDSNPIGQIMAMDCPQYAIVSEIIVFLFTLGVVQGIPAAKRQNLFQYALHAFVRSVGGLAIVIPFLIGKLPGGHLAAIDDHIRSIGLAMVVAYFSDLYMPADVRKYVSTWQGFSTSIVRANAACAGYEIGKQAFGGSFFMPLIIAGAASNGHEVIERMLGAFEGEKLSADQVLATFGGFVYYTAQANLGTTAMGARVVVVTFRLSADYVDYDGIFNNALNTISSNVKAAASKAAAAKAQSPGK